MYVRLVLPVDATKIPQVTPPSVERSIWYAVTGAPFVLVGATQSI